MARSAVYDYSVWITSLMNEVSHYIWWWDVVNEKEIGYQIIIVIAIIYHYKKLIKWEMCYYDM